MKFIQARRQDTLRALIIRPSALGDTLLLTPALHHIAGRVAVTLLGRKPGIDFLRPFVTQCLDYEKGGWHTLFSEETNCEDLPLPGVDTVISFLSDPSRKITKRLKACLENIPVFTYPPFPPKQEHIHVAVYLASCLKEAGLPVNPEVAIEEARKKTLFEKNRIPRSQDMIVFHPGSGSKKKNCPPEFWIELIKNKDLGIFQRRVLLLGPAEEEWHELFAKELQGVAVKMVISPDRHILLSLLKDASLYVGHDSGITHLAGLLGTSTIAVFKNTNPFQWAPLGPDVMVVCDVKSPQIIYRKIQEKVTDGKKVLP
ncbi:MAG: glycosyltransferase family 9 protein [Deltaproteobacteria bacterium]|nr:glycosyltransferase family 9 protein [Deltaproteobacteria bacterium]MBW2339970.1 glycosyltransferase family 9 protein [Deltaproteobacteria bacterium]